MTPSAARKRLEAWVIRHEKLEAWYQERHGDPVARSGRKSDALDAEAIKVLLADTKMKDATHVTTT